MARSMNEPRLATHMRVSALIRQCAEQGDFATVIRKGDPVAGALLVVAREKGQNPVLYEAMPTPNGAPKWDPVGLQHTDNEQLLQDYLDRRVSRDPDIWILELDVAFAERLDGLLGQHS